MSLNSQELEYLARLVKSHEEDLKKRQVKQVNQMKYGFLDSPEFASALWFKLLDESLGSEQVPEGCLLDNNLVPTNDKGSPRIEYWDIIDGCVSGYFYSRQNMPDGVQATTTEIESITNGVLRTTSGSVYQLGVKENNPNAWMYKNKRKISGME